jgi:hypothetical protein
MAALKDILGVFLCLLPIFGVVAYLAWATRRRQCPKCQKLSSGSARECSHCSEPLSPP